ncbi:ImmA/IrrE family metallo-endopeptidase [Micromonospora sp. 4G55]|uniref:ImmA/IrrE family metallo-endopeptidase n=1 Tax=Micromonospora sp. 4G55 TaxID=2806102 RepID=UPI001A36879A|nr:ImmA/IrrE family metallo-endopeptidase [Micromonospora sp. 4G55]MBM0255549.1 ImmA/IrrE family metallo-endopeptidase [Micromonospora sp. 4G55]
MRWTQKLMCEVACEEREALGLGSFDQLDPYELADAHGIRVYTLTELLDWNLSTEGHTHFYAARSGSWSAALVPLGTARVIVENDGHALVRRRSSIAHEMGHHLLEHSFDSVILGEDHKRQFDKAQEKQAGFMAGELLVPQEAARKAAYSKWSNTQVASAYGVSEQFAQMQMRGARVIADRASMKYGFR